MSFCAEQIDWKQRFFVPTNKNEGIEILSVLLKRYPVIASDDEKGELDSDQEYNEHVAEVASPTIIDLDEWIISPTLPDSYAK